MQWRESLKENGRNHRWSELIEESLRFSSDSGLEKDASRSEIIESVKKAIDDFRIL